MGSHRAFIILSCMCLTNPPTLHIKSQKYFIFNVHGGLGEGSKAHINLQDCTGIMTVIRLLVGNQSLYQTISRSSLENNLVIMSSLLHSLHPCTRA